MDFILEHLAVRSYEEALGPYFDINALLCVAEEKDVGPGPCEYHKVPMIDMQPISVEQMKDAVEWIARTIQDHRIMVFCNTGVGRLPSVVVGYLCFEMGFSFGEAVEFVATRRPYMSILPDLIKTIEELKKRFHVLAPVL